MATSTLDVAIIDAGLSGLALALALHQQSIKCTIYEAREAPLNVGGGLMLVPNGLKVLEKLGVYHPLKRKGYNFDRIYFQDAESRRILETIEYGDVERYGFRALRIYRYTVLQELLAAVNEKSIPIYFNRRFDHVISETEDNVTWQFKDESIETASLLIGADGIHSTVRSYLSPGLKPAFASMAAIVAAVPTAQLELPE
jgi:2-polyprenyl-6-methoxyphenol hydroxylase-like FAD-dependent oxidoreductase